jgi:hypothetical protein
LLAKTASLSAAPLRIFAFRADLQLWSRLTQAKRFLAGVPIGLSFVKTVLNNLWTHIGYKDDGRLVHTDKKTGMQFVSVKTWPSLMAARQALDPGFSKIEWEELKEPPSDA